MIRTLLKQFFLRTGLLFLVFAIISNYDLKGQGAGEPEAVNQFSGSALITNNGISLLPSFSLGKPAAIFDMKAGRRLTFEPQFRFALEGKPWAFIFWWRYRLFDNEKFQLRVGAHPAFLFRTITSTNNGISSESIEAHRYIAAEIAPSYQLTQNISIGLYYLKGHGFQESTIKDSDFITLNSYFSNIILSDQIFIKFYPQVYFLRMDADDGFYVTATITLAKRDFPVTIESIINQVIQSDIPGDAFLWNLSLIYSFGDQYVALKN